MRWYYAKNGSQLGPVEQEELLVKISSSEIAQSDMVWREGMKDWLPVSKVNELVMAARPMPPSPPVGEKTINSPYSAPATSSHHIPTPYGAGANIPNYLWQSIVVTILCCWPLGIPAIVYAAKVEGLKARGDIAGAMAASASAKNWCMTALGLGIAAVVIWLLLAGTAAFSSHH